MPSLIQRAYKSIFKVTDRKDLRKWDHDVDATMPVYGLFHVFCDMGWEDIVKEQIENLKQSGLFEHTDKMFVSCIIGSDDDLETLQNIIGKDKIEIVSVERNPRKYEFPALDYIYEKSKKEDFLFYYFHTKGITYQTFQSNDKEFLGFRNKIISWRRMMEYFLFDKWRVAVNTLQEGYETYGSYLFPPFKHKMYAGNFWWARSDYFRTLDALTDDVKQHNRFMAEEWLLTKVAKPFSAFDTVADLYFVNIKPTIYRDDRKSCWDSLVFFLIYTYRKYQRKWFGYSYKKHCQEKFQKLKSII